MNKLGIMYAVGFGMVLLSSLSKVTYIPLNYEFGLFSVLPVLFWLGFSLMLCSLFNRQDFSLKFIIMFVVMWSLPALFENSVSVWDSFFHAVNTLTLKNYDWHCFFIPGFLLFRFFPNHLLQFLKIYRIFAALLFALIYFIFVKKITKEHYPALILSLFFCAWHQFHYSPQSFAISVAFLMLYCLFEEGRFYTVLYIVCGIYLSVSHPPNFLIIISFLLTLSVFEFVFKRKLTYSPKKKFILLFLAVWIIWLLIFAGTTTTILEKSIKKNPITGIFHKNMDYIEEKAINPESRASRFIDENNTVINTLDEIEDSSGYLTIAPKLRLIALVLMLALDIIYFAVHSREIFTFKTAFLLCFILSLIIVIEAVQILSLNFTDRPLLYFSLFSAIIAAELARKSRLAIAVAVIISILVFPTLYYQESLYITSKMHLYAGNYINSSQNCCTNVYAYYYLHPNNIATSDYVIEDEYTKNWYRIYGLHKYSRLLRSKAEKDMPYNNGIIRIYHKL